MADGVKYVGRFHLSFEYPGGNTFTPGFFLYHVALKEVLDAE